MVDFKNFRFQSFTQIHQTCQIQKICILESDLKNMRFRCEDSLVSYGREPDSYENVCGFKNVRILVDGALNRSGEWFPTKRFW